MILTPRKCNWLRANTADSAALRVQKNCSRYNFMDGHGGAYFEMRRSYLPVDCLLTRLHRGADKYYHLDETADALPSRYNLDIVVKFA